MMKKAFLLIAVMALLLSGPANAAYKGVLTVAAASDLSAALREIAMLFEDETGTKAVISFGSTGMLATQIEHGAPFDVFLAADERYVEALAGKGRILRDTAVVYANGSLALAVNKGLGMAVKDLRGLREGRIRRLAIANPDHAPYGRAAVEALKNSGVWEDVKGKLVYGENIRQAMQFVQTGDAEAGIIALSIADAPGINYAKIDPALHAPIRQAAGVVSGAKDEMMARAFVLFIRGTEAKEVLKRYGFIIP